MPRVAVAAVVAVAVALAAAAEYEASFHTSSPLGVSLSAELRVVGVARGSPAALANAIAAGDVLVAVNGVRVAGIALADVQRLIGRAQLPRTLTFARAAAPAGAAATPPVQRLTGTVAVYRDRRASITLSGEIHAAKLPAAKLVHHVVAIVQA